MTSLNATRDAQSRSATVSPYLPYGAVNDGPTNTLRAVADLCRRQLKFVGMEAAAVQGRGDLAKQIALIFRAEMRGALDANGMPTMRPEYVHAPLEAAADTDTIGTLAGTLVAQRWLDLFKYTFPLMPRILTDFSDTPSELNQTVATRRISTPAVQTYDPTLDTDGRPLGWKQASAATTVDATITLDELIGVPIPFSMSALSSTQRLLFGEQAEAQIYAVVEYFIAKIYALCTAANFNAYATANETTVPIAYATYPVAEVDFARSHVTRIGAAFDTAKVPDRNRTLLLNAQYYAAGARDPSLVTFFAGQQAPEIITEGRLPMLNNFALVKAPNFPATNNRVGIALQKNGLIAKSRLPANLIEVFPGAGNGTANQVTDLDTGFTLMLIRYVNNLRGYAEQIACAIIGAAKGDSRGGLVITNQ